MRISPSTFIFLKSFNSEFSNIKVWFTDQSSKSLKIENRIYLALVFTWCRYIHIEDIKVKRGIQLVQYSIGRYLICCRFLSFA